MIRKNYYIVLYPLLALLVLLLSSPATSPLFGIDTGDSSIFILMGQAILKGKILYKDLFDHKGPVFFFIQALGQLIYPGNIGIFVLQIINLSIIYFMIRKISLFFVRPGQIWFILIPGSLFWMTMNSGGNSNEEFSLIFILIPIFYVLKHSFSGKIKHPFRYSLIYGVCFGLTSFIRLNNSAISGAIVLSIVIYLLSNKEIKNTCLNILYFISGFMIVCLPICIYFYANDAFSDMVYATFLHNIKYATADEYFPRWIVLLSLLFAIIALINIYIYSYGKKYYLVKIMILIVAFNFIATNFSTRFYLHYHVLDIPTIVLGISLFICNCNNNLIHKSKKVINVILLSTAVLHTGYYTTNIIRDFYKMLVCDHNSVLLNYPQYQIPEEDKNSAIGYNVSARWYLTQNIIPCYKYFTMQKWMAKTNPQILKEFDNMIITKTPKWILVSSGTGCMSPEVKYLLDEKYEIKAFTPERPLIKNMETTYDEYGYTLYHLKKSEK